MFTISQIAINSSFTSKRVHVCRPTQVFPLFVLLEFSSVRGNEKRLKPQFHCIHDRFECMQGKKKKFWERKKGECNLRGKESVEIYRFYL